MGVDALAGKYPSLSPYCYVGGNPVLLVDKTGYDITIYGVSPMDRTNVPLVVIKTNRISTKVNTPILVPSLDVIIGKPIEPLVYDLDKALGIEGMPDSDAYMISVGVGGAMGGGLAASWQVVAILEGEDQGFFFYKPDHPDVTVGVETPGISLSGGFIDFIESSGQKLNRKTFEGFSQGISLSSGAVSLTTVTSCVEGACPYIFGGHTLYYGMLTGLSASPISGVKAGARGYISESSLMYSIPYSFTDEQDKLLRFFIDLELDKYSK